MKSYKAKINNENLISLVGKHPNLWNPFLRSYRNKNVRYVTWQRIAAILGVESEFCQRRWRTLRDRYKKEKNGTVVTKNDKPWEFTTEMSFLDKINKEDANSWKDKPLPDIQPFTSHPVIITVPKNKILTNKIQTRALRPIVPRPTVEQPIAVLRTKVKNEGETSTSQTFESMAIDVNPNDITGNESEEQVPAEPEIYLVTPTLFNDQERTLFKKSLTTPTKRILTPSNDAEEVMVDGARAKKAAIEEETALRRQEFEHRLQWEEKEHLLRVQCQEDEHKIKMQVEQARLKVEEGNLKIKEQKLKVLLAKEAYFKSLTKSEE